jgi:A/G-specific adenine glycosylase
MSGNSSRANTEMPRSRAKRALDPTAFRRRLLAWFEPNKRDFPWRRTGDPYAVLVSEIMLQQTQTSRVAERLPLWLERFPTISSLATAPVAEVLRAWSGLGYNRRALSLHQLAKTVAAEHGGTLPASEEGLRRLPGIGPYTAAAVMAFAHNRPSAAVDVNVQRVLQRLFRPRSLTTARDAEALLRQILTRTNSRALLSALMDFGATVCASVPKCASCPFRRDCPSAFTVIPIARSARKRSPGARAEPRRIYRGRALKTLVSLGPRTLAELGPQVLPGYVEEKDATWLEGILASLRTEGFVEKHRGKYRLSS